VSFGFKGLNYFTVSTNNHFQHCLFLDKDEEVKGVSLSHSLHLTSVYGTPEYTNFTEGFAGCLDYIFYQHDQLNVDQVSLLYSSLVV
jgi:2',5'-phosphodiesterase